MPRESSAPAVSHRSISGTLLNEGIVEARSGLADGTAAPMPASSNGQRIGGLSEWLATTSARELEGRWVALSPEFEVLDVADSPATLVDRAGLGAPPLIVFVQPPRVRFGG